jgi:hypothetical protein
LSDINGSPGFGRLYPFAGYRIEGTKILSPIVKNLDLTVQRIPGVKPLAGVAAPPPFA